MGRTLETLVVKSSSPSLRKLIDELKARKAEQVAILRQQVLCGKRA